MAVILAASVDRNAGQVLIACLWLLAALGVLALVVWYFRRRWLSREQRGGTPFTLDELRRMRENGTVTAEEYERMRAVLVSAASGKPSGRVPRRPEPEWDWVAGRDGGDDRNGAGTDFDLKK